MSIINFYHINDFLFLIFEQINNEFNVLNVVRYIERDLHFYFIACYGFGELPVDAIMTFFETE